MRVDIVHLGGGIALPPFLCKCRGHLVKKIGTEEEG